MKSISDTTDFATGDANKIYTTTFTKNGSETSPIATKQEHEQEFSGLITPSTSTSTWEEHDFSTEFSPSPGAVDHDMVDQSWPWDSDHYWPEWVGADAGSTMMNHQDLSIPAAPGRSAPALTRLRTGSLTIPILDDACLDIDPDLDGHQSSISTSTSTPISSGASISNPSLNLRLQHHDHIDLNLDISTPPSSVRGGSEDCAADTQSCITQLSELLSRLSSTFITAQQEIPHSKSSNSTFMHSAFDSVASLVSTNGDSPNSNSSSNVVRDTFNASQRLLEILQQLQDLHSSSNVGSPSSGANSPEFTSSHFPPSRTHNPLGITLPTIPESRAPSPVSPGQNVHHSVLHHLILACHSLLLNIYNPLVTAVQHFVDFKETNSSAMNEMRMVLLVQTISFLIERMKGGVGAYLVLHRTMEVEGEISEKLLRLKHNLGI
jgi:hypothetical protein